MGKKIIEDIGSRGRVTIPQKVRKKLDLKQGDYVKLDIEKAGMDAEKAKKQIEDQGKPPRKRPEKKQRSDKRDRNRKYNVFGK